MPAMADPITRLNTALEGRYTIERELGEGGMAIVYLADDLKHNRNVALKVSHSAVVNTRSRLMGRATSSISTVRGTVVLLNNSRPGMWPVLRTKRLLTTS